MATDDSSTLSTNTISDYLVPVTIDKEPIIFEDNDATIEGILYEIGRFYKRNGLFQMLFKHRAVSLSNGKLAVEAVNSVWFTTGRITDPHDFDDVCPPTAKRFADKVATLTSAGSTAPPDLTNKGMPKSVAHEVILAPHVVESNDALLLKSLSHVFGAAESIETLFDDADGSGLELLKLLRARSSTASARDKALIAARHARIVREGVQGELQLAPLKAFLKEYKKAKRDLAPAVRQSAEAEVEMINLIAAKDAGSREIYDLRALQAPPTTLTEASDILLSILRGRVRAEQIDEVTSGAKTLALSASTANGGAPHLGGSVASTVDAAVASALAAVAASGRSPAAAYPAKLNDILAAQLKTALAATLKAVVDPRKTRAGEEGKVDIPRGADNKPIRWVDGMALCRCGINGGKHLFKDCPKKAEKEKKEKEKKAAAAAKAAAEKEQPGAAAVADADAADSLSKQLAALLASISPAGLVVDGQPAGKAPDASVAQGGAAQCGDASADGK